MQPYRHAKPHGDGCGQCVPAAPGHQLCQHAGCDELAEAQHRRHVTAADYEALPESFRPIDGIAHQAVFTCLDHEVDPICGSGEHPAPGIETADTADCPKCGAGTGNACVKADGKPRSSHHAVRSAPASGIPTAACDHVHREDCEGQGACACSADDEAPVRRPRIIDPSPLPAPAPIHVVDAQGHSVFDQHGQLQTEARDIHLAASGA